uniref:Ubiquitin-like protease family profile domain-containing protein n=1 Tax=Cucumis melo TaxID=3656 RepID=A0A9I9E1Z3_CUCME
MLFWDKKRHNSGTPVEASKWKKKKKKNSKIDRPIWLERDMWMLRLELFDTTLFDELTNAAITLFASFEVRFREQSNRLGILLFLVCFLSNHPCSVVDISNSNADLSFLSFCHFADVDAISAISWMFMSHNACPRQLDSVGCGYYVQKYIHEIVHNSSTPITSLFNTKSAYRQEEIDEIQTKWASFVS